MKRLLRAVCLALCWTLLMAGMPGKASAEEAAPMVRVLLRRLQLTDRADLTLAGAYTVRVGGEEVVLTLKEYELLKLLMLHPGIVFSRDKLLNDIWGYEFSGETRTVDVHIRTLRQKLGEAGELIETIRGVGYRMAAEK